MNQSGAIENSKFIRLNFFNGPERCGVEPMARNNRRTAPTLQPQAGKSGQARGGGVIRTSVHLTNVISVVTY
jgi:hypothetical protein